VIEISDQELLAKIGTLVVQNDALREIVAVAQQENAELKARLADVETPVEQEPA
jgi:outer membrane murein-binding lipoprotein Lpp